MKYTTNYKGRYLYIFFLVLALIIGFVLRFNWIMHWKDRGWLHDEYYLCHVPAENAFNGKGFAPDAEASLVHGIWVAPPMQSFFLFTIYKIAGTILHPIWPKMIQLCLSMVGLLICAAIGKRLVSPLAGIIFAFMVAVFPDFVYWTEALQTENNYLFGLTLLLYLLLFWNKNPKPFNAFVASLCLGLLTLQRGNSLLLGPALALFALFAFKETRTRFCALIFLIVPFFVLLPWLARNLEKYQEPILVCSIAGLQLHLGNRLNYSPIKTPYIFKEMNENKNHNVLIPEIEEKCRAKDGNPGPYNFIGTLKTTGYKYSSMYQKAALSYIFNHPIHSLKNYALKMFNQFYLIQDGKRIAVPFLNYKRVYRLLHRIILFGGFAGLFLLLVWGMSRDLYLIATVFAYYAGTGALFSLSMDGRFNLYLKLFLMIFLASGFDLLFHKIKARFKT